MTQTPVTVTYSLEEVLGQVLHKLDRLDEKFDGLRKEVDEKFDGLRKEVVEVKIELVKLEAGVKAIGQRLDTQEFINRSVVVGLILALAAGAVKIFFPGFPG